MLYVLRATHALADQNKSRKIKLLYIDYAILASP